MSDNISAYNSRRTHKERSEQARRAGIASARARQERKSMAETLDIVLKMTMDGGKPDAIAGAEGVKDAVKSNLTVQDMIIMKLVGKAVKGDLKAIELLTEMLGENPVSNTVSPLDALAKQLSEYKD